MCVCVCVCDKWLERDPAISSGTAQLLVIFHPFRTRGVAKGIDFALSAHKSTAVVSVFSVPTGTGYSGLRTSRPLSLWLILAMAFFRDSVGHVICLLVPASCNRSMKLACWLHGNRQVVPGWWLSPPYMLRVTQDLAAETGIAKHVCRQCSCPGLHMCALGLADPCRA